jgi:hypothetical protein
MASQGAPAHYRFHWADLGTIAEWSQPTDTAARPKWPMYSLGALAAESTGFDFYLVDGRFRVASAAACFLHAARTGKQPDEFAVAIHDFSDRVPTYGAILALTYSVDGFMPPSGILSSVSAHASGMLSSVLAHVAGVPPAGAKLVVLRRKQEATDEQFLALWEKYKFVLP